MDFLKIDKKYFAQKRILGFTVIELIMTMVMIGILAYVGVSRFADISTFRSRFFYDDILDSIRYAQKYAMGTGCHTQVSVNASTLTLTQRVNCTTGNFTLNVVDPASPGASSYTRTAPAGQSITGISPAFPIYFDGLGQAHTNSGTISNTPYSLTVGSRAISIVGPTGLTQ